jgi:hypothetical protein
VVLIMDEEEVLYYTCPTCGANLDLDEVCDECYPKHITTYNQNYKTVKPTRNGDENNDKE